MTKTVVISLLVCFPQIQAANGKLLGLKVRVLRLIILTELERRLQQSLERRFHIFF